jgi:hypothetical protein
MTAMGIEGTDDDLVRDLAGEMPIEITTDEYLRITGRRSARLSISPAGRRVSKRSRISTGSNLR